MYTEPNNYICDSVEQTALLAKTFVEIALASFRCAPAIVLLEGAVGVGKSVFVRHALHALGVDTQLIISPTFTLINEYEISNAPAHSHSTNTAYHADVYRLQSDEALLALDFDSCVKDGFVFVEWAQNFARNKYPMPQYCIVFSTPSAEAPNKRMIDIAYYE